MSSKRVKYVKAEDERRKGFHIDEQTAPEPASKAEATEISENHNPPVAENLIHDEADEDVEVIFRTEDEAQDLLVKHKPVKSSSTIVEQKDSLPFPRILGLFASLMIAVLAFALGLILLGSDNKPVEQCLSLLALITNLGTYAMLYWNEFTLGSSSEIWKNPVVYATLRGTKGMVIGNVGFGTTFTFGIVAQSISGSEQELTLLTLWFFMMLVIALVIYFPFTRVEHNIFRMLFVVLLICTLIVEVAFKVDDSGWYEISLSFIVIGQFVSITEVVLLRLGVEDCTRQYFRNQLYIHFSFIFYLIGLVNRAFS